MLQIFINRKRGKQEGIARKTDLKRKTAACQDIRFQRSRAENVCCTLSRGCSFSFRSQKSALNYSTFFTRATRAVGPGTKPAGYLSPGVICQVRRRGGGTKLLRQPFLGC